MSGNHPCMQPPTGTVTLKEIQWKILTWPHTYRHINPKRGGKGWEPESAKIHCNTSCAKTKCHTFEKLIRKVGRCTKQKTRVVPNLSSETKFNPVTQTCLPSWPMLVCPLTTVLISSSRPLIKNTKLNKLTLIDKRHNVIKDIVHHG